MQSRDSLLYMPIVAILISLLLIILVVALPAPNYVVVTSSGQIAQSFSLTLVASPSPSILNQALTLQGTYKDGQGLALGQQAVLIQYSSDLKKWYNLSAQTGTNGTYSVRWTPRSTGIVYFNATTTQAIATYSHLVANYIVSTTADLLNTTPKGGVVFIKRGTYDLNPTLHYPYNQIVLRSNLSLIGEGIDRTIIRMFPTQQPAQSEVRSDMTTANADIKNLVIDNLTMTQNGTPDNLGSNAISIRKDGNGTYYNSSNITVRNVRVNNCYGAAIGITNTTGIIIENSIVENTWTGIIIADSQQVKIVNNRISQCRGDGFYFPETVSYVTIQGNSISNVEDTSVDLSSWNGLQPHQKIVINNNKIINGSHVRITNSIEVNITSNDLQNTDILIDAGQARSMNITISDNIITTNSRAAMLFLGAMDAIASNNTITMTKPDTQVVQSGMIIAIFGTGVIRNNTILNAQNYGLSFGGYGLGGGTNLTITGNNLINFGDIGIWDDGKKQGGLFNLTGNTIWDKSYPFVSEYGIRTDYVSNKWVIANNTVYAGSIAYISAPSSQIIGNVYSPPS